MRIFTRAFSFVLAASLAFAAGCGGEADAPSRAGTPAVPTLSAVAGLEERLAAFPPMPIEAELAALDETERRVVDTLARALGGIDEVYLRQVDRRNPLYRTQLAAVPGRSGHLLLDAFSLHAGLYERQLGRAAFVVGAPPRPPGAGFYPSDLTVEEWERTLRAEPDREAELIGTTRVVVRDGDALRGVPYGKHYAAQLEPVARSLRDAGLLTRDDGLQALTALLAESLSSDAWDEAEAALVEARGPIELVIGPFETDDDRLFGYKSSYEGTLALVDQGATESAAIWRERLAEVFGAAPNGEGPGHRIVVTELVAAAGRARAGVQASTVELPLREVVRLSAGAKTLLHLNVLFAKHEAVLRPLAARLLTDPAALDARLHAEIALFHELSHEWLPDQSAHGDALADLLLEYHTTIRELSATLMSFDALLELGRRGELEAPLEPLQATFLLEQVRLARLGGRRPIGRAAHVILGHLLDGQALRRHADGRLVFDHHRVSARLRALRLEVRRIEERGDIEAARALLERNGPLTDALAALLADVQDLPLDFRPIYTLTGDPR